MTRWIGWVLGSLALAAFLPLAAGAAETAKSVKAADSAKPDAKTKSAATAPVGIPQWNAPGQYSVDMICNAEGKKIEMKRQIDGKRIRSDITMEGHQLTMIEVGDDIGTTITLMHDQKRAMKQSSKALEAMAKKAPIKPAAEEPAQEQGKVEFLGQEEMNGKLCDKYRSSFGDQTGVSWIDPETKFPVRMEAAGASIDWKNYKVGSQPAALFEVPKGYEVMDMDEMMKKMGDMQSSGQLGQLGGMAGGMGIPGGGGVGGMANQMAGQYGGQFGSQMGGQLGASLGAAFGGPIGAMAGNYIGGKVGGMIGSKVAKAVVPGK